jgi:predicted TIM-barrel fold metal-dependent hydrolase
MVLPDRAGWPGGIHVVAADFSVAVPPDLWTTGAPASMVSRMPVGRTGNGKTSWYAGNRVWSTARPPGPSVRERLRALDTCGIWAQIIYPDGGGFAADRVSALGDKAVRTLVVHIYNEFLAQVQRESAGRLFPQAILPAWDADVAVQETARLLDRGIRGFSLSDKPDILGAGPMFDPRFTPMWDLLDRSGAVVNFQVGAEEARDQRPAGRQGIRARAAARASKVRMIANFCLSNLFGRFPGLKVVATNCGLDWGPRLLESLELLFRDTGSVGGQWQAPGVTGDYLRRHLYVISPPERAALERLVGAIGSRNIIAESGLLGPVCDCPELREPRADVLAGQAPQVIRDILQDNAARLYRIELPGSAVALPPDWIRSP